MKRLLTVAAALCVTLSSHEARALDEAACCLASTSQLDAMISPVLGGDEKFFALPGGVPNVLFIYDNSGSMYWWPQKLCAGSDPRNSPQGSNGCDCAVLNDVGYDPAVTYESEIDNLNSNKFWDEWFNPNKVYDVKHSYCNDDDWMCGQYGDTPDNSGPSPQWGTGSSRSAAITSACTGATNVSNCTSCLATRGYYLDQTWSKSRMVGNFLNHYSPRYIMARRVLKQVIREIRPVRMSLYKLNGGMPSQVKDFNPPCNLSTPNNSSFDSNRNTYISLLDGITVGGGTPLTRSLYAAGHAYAQKGANVYKTAFGDSWASAMGFTETQLAAFEEGGGENQKAVCFDCTFSAIVMLTDGEPTLNWNYYENSVPAPVGGAANQLEWDDCPECKNSNLDELAKFLWGHDMRPDHTAKQALATYTVGFGLDSSSWGLKLLNHTAEVGGGLFYAASNGTQLRDSLLEIFDNINTRNTAFSSASIATLQTGDSSLSALIPRFSPQKAKPWKGELYRFRLFNEFVLDKEHPQDGDAPGSPGYKADIFITDKDNPPDGQIVVEDSDGRFIKKGTNTKAKYFWEAREELVSKGYANRKVYTVLDSSGPDGAKDGALTHHDELVELSSANVESLIDYLGLKGTTRCPSGTGLDQEGVILRSLGLTVAKAKSAMGYDLDPAVDTNRLACGRLLIDFIRGRDVGDEDGDGDYDETRDSVLADIFHSSPVIVDPPVDKFLCRFGLHNQCVMTLFEVPPTSPATAVPLASYGDENDCKGRPTTRDAYDSWAFAQRKRHKVVLVGSNGAMLHAFHNGAPTESCSEGGVSEITYDHGRGEEVWAFIPPDLLPRLVDLTGGHAFYVDGDIMVRDVWADKEGGVAARKERDEYHTLAVVAEGRGGTHYFALEMNYDSNTGEPLAPGFRWMYPQPCTEEAALFGKTLYALSPKPPPVGPVLIDTETITGMTGVDNYNTKTMERWVVMLSGGWSASEDRGRGIYMVDAWEGLINGRGDNLWWKWDKPKDGSTWESGDMYGSRQYLTHSIVAPVAMVDYGGNEMPVSDGFFDTGIVGDTAGQIWVARFHSPGALDEDTKLIGNWAAGRTFEQDRAGGNSVVNDNPIHYLVSSAIFPENKALHTYVGTGNRYSLLDPDAGVCRFDNLLACSKYKCGEMRQVYELKRGDLNLTKNETHWKSQKFDHAKSERSSASEPWCGEPGETVVVAQMEDSKIDGCPGGKSFGEVRDIKVDCGRDSAGSFRCRRVDNNTAKLDDLKFSYSTTGLGKNRFYGIWAYGRRADRMFDETLTATTAGKSTALQFDSARLSDKTTANSDSGDLVDVTLTTCDAYGTCTGNQATADSNGWFFEYERLADKTASGSAVLASCALWNTLYPQVETTSCGERVTPWGRFVQADIYTGAPNCAYSFKDPDNNTFVRYQERKVLAPPPEPATAIQLSKSGAIKYSTLVLEPGQDQATEVSVSAGQDRLQMIYELPIDQSLHMCRHEGAEHCTPAH